MLQDRLALHFNESLETLQNTLANLGETIQFAAHKLVAAILNDNKILICGNGASAAIAQQFSSAMLNRFERERPALPAIALTTDIAAITAIAEDYHFDDIFAKQVKALGQNEDILLVFASNGNPANIVKAITAAHDKNIAVVALTGHDGGMVAPMLNTSDIEIRIPSTNDSRIHEAHLVISHCLCDLIDQQIFGGL
ncbi:MAG: phosphoheptose isomerase [Methylomicrobium sp.]